MFWGIYSTDERDIMRIIVNEPIVVWKLGRELDMAGIPNHGMSLFGSVLEILLVDENQGEQAQVVVDAHDGLDSISERQKSAQSQAQGIPGWAIWSETQALEWWTTTLSDTHVDAIGNLTDAKALMKKQNAGIKAMVRMLIAMRDQLWPQLPEG